MNNKIYKILEKIIPLLMAIFSYLYIFSTFSVKKYAFFPSILFIVFVIIFYNNDFKNKILKKEVLITSLLFAFLYTYGNVLEVNLFSVNVNTYLELLSFNYINMFIGVFNIFYVILNYLFPKLYNYKLSGKKYGETLPIIVFSLSFVFILAMWLPYSYSYYPGLITNDSIDVIRFIKGNLNGLTNHHPVIFTLFAYVPIKIGLNNFHSLIVGVALFTIFQMFVMAAIFAYTIVFLYKRKVPKFALILTLLFYALLPLHAVYSITMWKDIIFGGLLLLLTIEVIKFVELSKQKEIKFKELTSFMIVSLLCALFRNNAIYMFIILSIVTYVIFKTHRKVILKSFGLVIVSYFLIVGPGYKLCGIKQTESTEYVSIPLQQVGRMVHKEVKLTKQQEKLINDLIPINTLKKAYYPVTVDSIKWNKEYNDKVLSKNKMKYLKLWITMCLKHPGIALEAQSAATLGYWYPEINYWYAATPVNGVNVNNKYGIYLTPKTSKAVYSMIESNTFEDKPIVNIEWNFVLWLYVIFIFNIVSFKKKKWEGIMPYVPIFGIWFTLMIATPVYAEFRYIYGAFTVFPLLLIYPYLKK